MEPILTIAIAGLAGLAFGSFLNVCVSRWPAEKSVIRPRSYCDSCERTLSWWENIPVLSWLALRGRCRTCGKAIGLRHLLVELAVGGLWALTAWQTLSQAPHMSFAELSYVALLDGIAQLIFFWLLVGLAAMDAEHLWLPDALIIPGILIGFALNIGRAGLETYYVSGDFAEWKHRAGTAAVFWFLGAVIPAGLVIVVRFLYRVVRGQEGMGMGDVKLMAMVGGWLGAKVALLAFVIGVLTTAAYALTLLSNPELRGSKQAWAKKKIPFGAFLCLGGVVGGLWGQPIVDAYMRWAGF
jgi:leader peptidase (prepilin peptidase)/N-methyltransferase